MSYSDLLIQRWNQLGLPQSVLTTHPDLASHLVKSKLAYHVAGYSNSTDASGNKPFKLEGENILLHIQGHWENCAEVKEKLMREGSRWIYTSLKGFIPGDRLEYLDIHPVHKLSLTQYQRIHSIAMRFLEVHQDVDPSSEKECILQLMTTSNSDSGPFYLEHCTIRLVRPVEDNIEVYSCGIEMEEEQYRRTMPKGPAGSWINKSVLTTVRTKIGIEDFMEFRDANERRITSIPLTRQRADRVLQRINELSKQNLRFNYMGQNCYCLAQIAMEESGHPMPDLRLPLSRLMSLKLIDREGHPYIAALLEHENMISRLFYNTVTLAMGGYKISELPPEEDSSGPLSTYSCQVPSVWDYLTNHCSTFRYHSIPFVEWQLEQRSTEVIRPIPGRPQLYGL